MGLIKAGAPYVQFKQALLDLEKRWLREARTDTERLQIRRGIAEDILTQAFGSGQQWPEFGRCLRRVLRLGFSNLALHVHVACMYVQALHRFPEQAGEAWSMLEEAERRVLRLRRRHWLRKESRQAITHARQVARVSPPGAPARYPRLTSA
jgi:hypothetical protein